MLTFELLRELVPRTAVIAVLHNQDNPIGEPMVSELGSIARAAGLQFLSVSANNDGDLNTAFANVSRDRADDIVVAPDPYLDSRRDQLVGLAANHRMPAIYQWREFVDAGGLVSYGTNLADAHRQVGIYTGSILNGTKPADLPVLQPSRFELVLNLKTAKALGITIPNTLLA